MSALKRLIPLMVGWGVEMSCHWRSAGGAPALGCAVAPAFWSLGRPAAPAAAAALGALHTDLGRAAVPAPSLRANRRMPLLPAACRHSACPGRPRQPSLAPCPIPLCLRIGCWWRRLLPPPSRWAACCCLRARCRRSTARPWWRWAPAGETPTVSAATADSSTLVHGNSRPCMAGTGPAGLSRSRACLLPLSCPLPAG